MRILTVSLVDGTLIDYRNTTDSKIVDGALLIEYLNDKGYVSHAGFAPGQWLDFISEWEDE